MVEIKSIHETFVNLARQIDYSDALKSTDDRENISVLMGSSIGKHRPSRPYVMTDVDYAYVKLDISKFRIAFSYIVHGNNAGYIARKIKEHLELTSSINSVQETCNCCIDAILDVEELESENLKKAYFDAASLGIFLVSDHLSCSSECKNKFEHEK